MDSSFNNIQHIIQDRQGMAFLSVFVAGLISAASPCVLAAIPHIIGYVGGYSEGNKKKRPSIRSSSFSVFPSPSRSWAWQHHSWEGSSASWAGGSISG